MTVLLTSTHAHRFYNRTLVVDASIVALLSSYLTRDIIPTLREMTNCEYDVVTSTAATNGVIRVQVNGTMAAQEYSITGSLYGDLVIQGGSWRGCRHGLYAWLNELGAFSLAPGDRWKVITPRTDLRLSLNINREPAIETASGGGQGAGGVNWPFEDEETKYIEEWRKWLDWQGAPRAHYVAVGVPLQNFGPHYDPIAYSRDTAAWDADPDLWAQPYRNWQANHLYYVGAGVSANGNRYICVTAGTSAAVGTGPSGVGSGITDGTAVWNFAAAGTRTTSAESIEFHMTHTGKSGGVEYADYDDLQGGIGIYADLLGDDADANVAGLADVPSLTGLQMTLSAAVGDGGSNCRCPKCINLLRNGLGVSADSNATDCSLWRAGRIWQAIKATRPSLSLQITDLAYDRQSGPPTPGWAVSPHLHVILAQNSFRSDGLATSILLERWVARAALDGFKLGTYDYWSLPSFLLNDARFPAATAWRDARSWIDARVASFSGESTYSTGAAGLQWWGLYQLIWRGSSVTNDALISDFCTKAFGSGAPFVKRTLDRWWAREWPTYAPNHYEFGLAFDDLKDADTATVGEPAARARVAAWMAYVIFLHFRFRWYDTDVNALTPPPEPAADAAAEDILRHTWRAARLYMLDARWIHDSVLPSPNLSAGFVTDWTLPADPADYPAWRALNGITDYTDDEIRTLFDAIRATYTKPIAASYTTPTPALVSPYTPSGTSLNVEGWQSGNEGPRTGYEYIFERKAGATGVLRLEFRTGFEITTSRLRLYNAVTGALLETVDLDLQWLDELGGNATTTKDYNLASLAVGFYKLVIEITHPAIIHRVQHRREMPLVRVGSYMRSAWGGLAIPGGEPAGIEPHYFFVPKGVTAFHIFALPNPADPDNALIVRDGANNVRTPTMLGNYVYRFVVPAGQDKKVWRYEGRLATGPQHGTPRILDLPEWTSPTREQMIVPANLWAE
jgi:hypothetical protein